MLKLPRLAIARDEIREVGVYEQLRQQLLAEDAGRAEGIHASDLLDPRLAFWAKKRPKPLNERQVYFFTIGKVLHALLIRSQHEEHDPTKSDEGTHQELGVLFSPDMREDGYPIELKTTRASFEPSPEKLQEEFSHYFEQLAIYMVLMNGLRGELWVLFLNLKDATGRTFPEIRCYRVEVTEEDFYALEREVIRARDMLTHALEINNPSSLPLCRQWKCGESCPYWRDCRPPGRWSKSKREWVA